MKKIIPEQQTSFDFGDQKQEPLPEQSPPERKHTLASVLKTAEEMRKFNRTEVDPDACAFCGSTRASHYCKPQGKQID